MEEIRPFPAGTRLDNYPDSTMLEALLTDVRFAARGLRRSPGFTATAVLTLALGIAATTAVFSVVYGVIFRPLPFPNADRLVEVVQLLPPRGTETEPTRAGLTPDQITEWRATSRTLAAIGRYGTTSAAMTGGSTPVRLNGATVSVPLFRALGVAPLKGRLFIEEDEQPGNDQVVILSYRVWAARFGAADGVLETAITLNGRPYRVIGVMPDRFDFPSLAFPSMSLNSAGELNAAPEFWMPVAARARPAGPATGGLSLAPTLALLRPDVSLEQATAEVNTLMPARVGERYPVELVSARVEQAREVRPVLLLFQAAVLFVLFIACVNVVNLLLARGSERQQDLVVRLALGASRVQLARFAAAEGLLIGTGGGVLGCLIAYEIVALVRMLPPYLLPRMAEIRVDTMVLALAAGVSLVAGLSVGLTAAVRTVRSDLVHRWIPWPSRTVSLSRLQRPSRALVAAETAAVMILLAGAGLLLTSFVKLTSVDRGLQADNVFTFRISLPQPRYQAAAAQFAFHDEFASLLQLTAGVTAVGASTGMLGQWGVGFTLEIDGEPVKGNVWFNHVTPGVFDALRIPLRGRDFTAADRNQVANVAIVNDTFVRRYFGGADPIGRLIRFQEWRGLEIIGVAGDTRTDALDGNVNPAIYVPQEVQTAAFSAPTYVVRGSNAGALPAAIRAAALRLERDAVVFDAMTMDAFLARSVTTPKVYGMAAAAFAGVAVMLAALGLYGVLSYSIGRRTREFGIRIALGAARRSLLTTVMREALVVVAIGILAGTAGALYLSRFLETLLFGIEPQDPATFALVAALFLAVASVACYVPARRATRVDPVVALRAE